MRSIYLYAGINIYIFFISSLPNNILPMIFLWNWRIFMNIRKKIQYYYPSMKTIARPSAHRYILTIVPLQMSQHFKSWTKIWRPWDMSLSIKFPFDIQSLPAAINFFKKIVRSEFGKISQRAWIWNTSSFFCICLRDEKVMH